MTDQELMRLAIKMSLDDLFQDPDTSDKWVRDEYPNFASMSMDELKEVLERTDCMRNLR